MAYRYQKKRMSATKRAYLAGLRAGRASAYRKKSTRRYRRR